MFHAPVGIDLLGISVNMREDTDLEKCSAISFAMADVIVMWLLF